MAIQDILDAITAEADRQIATARAAHQKQLAQIRDESERRLSRKRQEIAAQKDQKIEQMRRKATAHADTLKRNAILQAKRAELDAVYAAVTHKLSTLPEAKLEPLLRSLLKQIQGKGTLYPAAAHADLLRRLAPSEQFAFGESTDASGGFQFVSQKQEYDCRFETVVEELVRPRTELAVSRSLFGTAA